MSEAILRSADERLSFCDGFFSAVQAQPVYESNDYREYKLPRDVDKEMTDRPYFWMWAENTNQDVPPTILKLAFTEEAMKRENERLHSEALAKAECQGMTDIQRMYFRPPTAEYVTLGSFRLEKIFTSLQTRGLFASVMPKTVTSVTSVVPWLMVNVLVSYRCDLVEQRFLSIGVCMSNGQVVERFYDMIHKIDMQPMTPIQSAGARELKIADGLQKVHLYLERKLQNESHTWATEAHERLAQEISQLGSYYRSILPDIPQSEHAIVEAERLRKEQELTERTKPRIDIQCKQVAVVGLLERK
jgi:hypothetical protein